MRNSGTNESNPAVVEKTDKYRKKDNLAFFADAMRKFPGNGPAIALVGSRDLPSVTLRRAQAVLRWDLSPGLWSHAFLIDPSPDNPGESVVREVTMHDRAGHFPEPEQNGVNKTTLSYFADPDRDANIAFLRINLTEAQGVAVSDRADQHNFDRVRHNFWDMLGVWQSYFWAFGQRPNPLRDGVPIFSSQYVEMAFEAIGIDLTPSASERNSAPEHLWNTARWWQKPLKKLHDKTISGWYVLRDKGCSLMNWEDRQAAHE